MRKFLVFASVAFLLTAGFSAPLVNAQVVDDASPNSWPVSSKVISTGLVANALVSRDLYFGMRNSNDVMTLQSFLLSRGYYNGPVTGNFLGLTLVGVKNFQKANGLPVTGYFGPLSRKLANGAYAGTLSIVPPAPILGVGESMQVIAQFQPPMPPCPPGMFCTQVMPAPVEVDAVWTSSDSSVAKIGKQVINCFTTPCNPIINLEGVKEGSALITATYSSNGTTLKATAYVQVARDAAGTLEIVPTATTNGGYVNSKLFTARYTEPEPACRRSLPACMVMQKAPYDVSVVWTTDNSKIFEVNSSCAISAAGTCISPTTTITTHSVGSANLNAQYTLPDGRIVRASYLVVISGQ
jgi:peptidoglycan hydrolase-like protein with peptidoglycan-binding domain